MKNSICKTCKTQFNYENKGKERVFCSIECYRDEQRKGSYKKNKKIIDTDFFILEANKAHKGKYGYIINQPLESNGFVLAVCPIHGEFKTRINTHIKRGCGCRRCGFVATKEKQMTPYSEFLKIARAVHGDRYEYLHPESYEGKKANVKIRCRIHGVFNQNAFMHLKGRGCQKCGVISSSGLWNCDKYTELCNERYEGKSNLYLIKCTGNNEAFYKVGITSKKVKDRFRGAKALPYDWEIVELKHDNAQLIHSLERQIHRILRDKKYTPKIHFAGYTECFSEVNRSIRNLFKDSDQIQLI